MPIVNGKHFSYTAKGKKAAARARKKKSYSKDAVLMAKEMT